MQGYDGVVDLHPQGPSRTSGGTWWISADYRPCTHAAYRPPGLSWELIAEILNVTLDELVGRTEAISQVEIQNPKLQALYREIHRLSDEDQQALVILLDSLIKRSQMGRVLAS